jgi:hypothetical protein
VCAELLSGRRAFADREPLRLMAACLDQSTRPTPSQLGVPQSAAVERVFAKALAVSAQARFHDVREFWSELRRAATGTNAVRQDPGVEIFSKGADILAAVASAPTAAPTEPSRSENRGPALLTLIESSRTVSPPRLALLAVGLVVALGLLSGRGRYTARPMASVPAPSARTTTVRLQSILGGAGAAAHVAPQPPSRASSPSRVPIHLTQRAPLTNASPVSSVPSAVAETVEVLTPAPSIASPSDTVRLPVASASAVPSDLDQLLNDEALTTRR